jgi:D-alanyl-lipoteichoic acid acyltransferase DltB (MBOAT superfamily)
VGSHLILWGYFKKLVVADNLAIIANQIFNEYRDYSGADLLIATLAFTFQIYCDFSGYSDIARGLAKLMGFDLMVNFKLPYFATSPSDFWSRWHISLSAWLRDYLYIPLGGNRFGEAITYRNLVVTMLLGGLWHGASWIFVLWGAYHGGILILFRLFEKQRFQIGKWTPIRILLMFVLTSIGWVIFRSENIAQLTYFLTHMGLGISAETQPFCKQLVFYLAPLLGIQVLQHWSGDLLIPMKFPKYLRYAFRAYLLIACIALGNYSGGEFIYFQF